jgi:hypothetical protein
MSRDGDYETEQIGLRLTNHLAPLALNAIRELRREESLCDGYVARGETAGVPTTGRRDSTGAAIIRAEEIRERLQRLFNLRNEVQHAVDSYAHFLKTRPEERIPAAADKPRCRDKQIELLHPNAIEMANGTKEWSDNTNCRELGEKAGLCPRHYMRWYRWKVDNDHDVSHLFEPSA